MEDIKLADRYDLSRSRIYLNGTQALVRLCLMQHASDRRNGLNTAGYVSGYRGSPLGALDYQFPAASEHLEKANVVFEPALNEDLAATALWGTQQAEMRGEGRYDGVFGLWYGKGPGVDRSGDVFRHANYAGSSVHGGVLALTGDDHTCESSTTAHQSEFALMDAMIPVLNPATVSELITFGLHGWAMSRFSGLWVGLKAVKDNIESTASIELPADIVQPRIPEAFDGPADGLNIRVNDHRVAQEARVHRHKLRAAQAFVRTNGLDKMSGAVDTDARIGIVSTGKSWLDVLQALEELGMDRHASAEAGIRLYKVAMSWPLEPEGARAFTDGLQIVVVVEEKRSLIEMQLRQMLYGSADAPQIIGKQDEQGETLFQPEGALNPIQIALVIGRRLQAMHHGDPAQSERWSNRLQVMQSLLSVPSPPMSIQRMPWFCAGCPHNSSTKVPEGARAYAGIGCHWMAQMMERSTEGFTQMGGEGANWIGESHFSTRRHVFQNLGDGTYNHSGLLAVRAALANNTNMTFKLLFNDAVAMTGGQRHEGGLTPYMIADELAAAGVGQIAWVTDQPELVDRRRLPSGTRVEHRDRLQAVQQTLAARDGVSVLIYQQTCAAEKRRRRKRGTLPDPARRAFINPAVCEGCGDCGIVSNCVAILPLETPLGRKRQIDQSACNKDFSCLKGFCPSFVTLEGARLRKPTIAALALPELPLAPLHHDLSRPYAIALTGVGGTGVVTVAAILGMAAHLDGKGCGIIDMAGLAQKGGAVVSHIKLAARPADISAIRIARAGAHLLLGCDLMVSASAEILDCLNPESSSAVINTRQVMPGSFTANPDFRFPGSMMLRRIREIVPDARCTELDAGALAERLFGNSIAGNLLLLGVAFQQGLIPLSLAAIERAITLNGVSVDMNLGAFRWGRAWVADQGAIRQALAGQAQVPDSPAGQRDDAEPALEDLLALHRQRLSDYQSTRWAGLYQQSLDKVIAIDTSADKALATAAAKSLYHLMSYKDEYEVARLLTDDAFGAQLQQQFDGNYQIRYHLAPPFLPGRDADGRPLKRSFGSWLTPLLRILASGRVLRGSWLDPFGFTRERREERRLIRDYHELLERLPELRRSADTGRLVELLSLPLTIRGYGPVKASSIERYRQQSASLIDKCRHAEPVTEVA